MDRAVRMRLGWVQLYERTANVTLVCRPCGISLPTLRKWLRRYQEAGLAGLEAASGRPHSSPEQKVDGELEGLILRLRQEYRLGARRLQGELIGRNERKLSLATIHKILYRNEVSLLKRRKTSAKTSRYERQVPGKRVQIDTCKIAPGPYQYAAVDDCSRFRVMEAYPRRSEVNDRVPRAPR